MYNRKVQLFLEGHKNLRNLPHGLDIYLKFVHSLVILISLKTMTIFNNTSADIKTKSADVLLKMVIVLSEMRIV